MADHDNGIALVFARTDTEWFQKSVGATSLLLFVKGRICFCAPDGSVPDRSSAPSLLMAFGWAARLRLAEADIAGMYLEAW